MEVKFTTTTCHSRPITVPWSPHTSMPSPYNIRDKTVPAHFCHIVKKRVLSKASSEDIGLEFLQRLPTKGSQSHAAKSSSIPVKKASTSNVIPSRHHFAPTTFTKPYLGLYDPDTVINTIAVSSANIPKNRLLHCGGGIVYPSPEIKRTRIPDPTFKIDWTNSKIPSPDVKQPPSVSKQHIRSKSTLLQRTQSLPHHSPEVLMLKRAPSEPLVICDSRDNDRKVEIREVPLPQAIQSENGDRKVTPEEQSPTEKIKENLRTSERKPDTVLQPPKKRAYLEPAEEPPFELPKAEKKTEAKLRVKTNLCEEKTSHRNGFLNPLEIRIEVAQNSPSRVIFEKPTQIQSLIRTSKCKEYVQNNANTNLRYSLEKRDIMRNSNEEKVVQCKERAEKLRCTLLSVMHALLGPKRMETLGFPTKSTDEMLIEVLRCADLSPKLGISYFNLRENTKLLLSLLMINDKNTNGSGWESLDPEEVLEEIYIRDVLPHLESVSRVQ